MPRVSRRRQPRFRAFIVTGALLGVLVGLLLALRGHDTGSYTTTSAVGYIASLGGLLGALLGGAVAALLAGRD